MAKKAKPYGGKKMQAAAKAVAKGTSLASSSTHRTVNGKGKVSTSQLMNGVNTRQPGC